MLPKILLKLPNPKSPSPSFFFLFFHSHLIQNDDSELIMPNGLQDLVIGLGRRQIHERPVGGEFQPVGAVVGRDHWLSI